MWFVFIIIGIAIGIIYGSWASDNYWIDYLNERLVNYDE